MKMKYFISWILVTILFTTYVLAQQGITTDSLKIKVNHKRSLPTSKINELFQNAKITPELEEKLKTINLDIRGYLSLHEGQDERCSALFCELIFIGKVLSIVDMPGPKSDLFHSKVNILIVEILKGPKQIKDTIQLMRKGGPITADVVNGILPGTIFQTTTDAIYRIGETSVFYANTIDND